MRLVGSGEICKLGAVRPIRFQHAINAIDGKLIEASRSGDKKAAGRLFGIRGKMFDKIRELAGDENYRSNIRELMRREIGTTNPKTTRKMLGDNRVFLSVDDNYSAFPGIRW